MDVFDSNVWIYGLTKTCAQASNYVDQVIRHDRRVAVSAYIYDEVMRNLDRSQHGHEEIDRVKTRFAEILYDNGRIEAPSDEEVRAMDIDEMRSDPAVQAMGARFDIQPKDVPILVFASQVSNRVTSPDESVVIRTADEQFSRFNASDYYPNIEIAYVDCSDA